MDLAAEEEVEAEVDLAAAEAVAVEDEEVAVDLAAAEEEEAEAAEDGKFYLDCFEQRNESLDQAISHACSTMVL